MSCACVLFKVLDLSAMLLPDNLSFKKIHNLLWEQEGLELQSHKDCA